MNKIHQLFKGNKQKAVFPIIGADHCAYLKKTTLAKVARKAKELADALEYAFRLYRYDIILIFSDPYVEAEALGCQIDWEPFPKILSRRENSGNDRTGIIIETAERLKRRVDVPIFVSIKGPFSLASFLGGTETFFKELIIEEEKIKEMIAEALEFQIRYLRSLLSLGVNIFIGDPCASASLISPKFFLKFAYQPLLRIIGEIKNNGLIVALHICGNTKPIIPFLDNLGCDILSLEDIKIETKTPKMGGVATNTIFLGGEEKIEKEVLEAKRIPSCSIIATSCDVPVTTPPEHIKKMIETAREERDG